MIDYVELRQAMRDMKSHQPLFRLIKAEIKLRGHWKNRARGISFDKGYDSRRNVTKF